MSTTRKSQWPVPGNALERSAFSIPEICFRNDISRTTYHRLRAEGRGPRETRFGLNIIRVTLEDERAWLQQLQQESGKLEAQAVEPRSKPALQLLKAIMTSASDNAEVAHHPNREK